LWVLTLTAVNGCSTCREASQGSDDEWRQLELFGVKQPVQAEVDNSDVDLPADKSTTD